MDAEWVSHRGETVEVCLAASSQSSGKRSALIWPDHRLTVPKDDPGLEVSAPLRYLYEPDGAVIRAGGIPVLAQSLGAALLDRSIAYLTSGHGEPSPFATAFKIHEVLPYDRRALRACACAPSARWRSRSAASTSIPPSYAGNCARMGRARRPSFSLVRSTEPERLWPNACRLALTIGEC